MLVAILSDIHGNLEALTAVWADMAAFAVDEVVCLGDMVGYGANPDEVLASVRARGARCCLGNHELGIVSPAERSWFNPTARKGLSLTASLLSPDSLAFIAGLPRFLLLAGARFVHGFPPDSVTAYLFQAEEARLASWFGRGETLTFVGHTHELMLVSWDGAAAGRRELGQGRFALPARGCIVNAGSVGQPRDGNNNAKYLLWDTDSSVVDVRFVPYDCAAAVEKIRARGFPEYYGTRLW
jgi:diadenosine tetraphosphatase ApaH/serine/threonine PP2A family protein phosphatase